MATDGDLTVEIQSTWILVHYADVYVCHRRPRHFADVYVKHAKLVLI